MSVLLIAAAIVFVLCAGTLLLAHRNTPPTHPARAHALWSGVLAAALLIVLAVVAAPRWQMPMPAPITATFPSTGKAPSPSVLDNVGPGTATVPIAASTSLMARLRREWPVVAGAIWLTGTLLLVMRFLAHLHWLHRRTRESFALGDPELQALRAHCATQLRLTRTPEIRLADVPGPIIWGFRAVVLVPQAAMEWNTAEWRAVLLHEFAHAHRRDFAWQSVGTLATAVHWFNPLIRRIVRRQRASAELAADALAVGGVPRSAYARALVDLAIRTPPAASTAFGGDTDGATLEERLAALHTTTTRSTMIAHPMLMSVLFAAPAFFTAGVRPLDLAPPSPPVLVAAAEWRGDPGSELRVSLAQGAMIGRSVTARTASVSAHWINASDVPLSIRVSWDEGRRNIEVVRTDGLPIEAPVEVRVAVPVDVDLILWNGNGTVDADVASGISGGTVDGDVRVRTPSWARIYTTSGTITAQVGELDSRNTRIVSQLGDVLLVGAEPAHGRSIRRGEVRAPLGTVRWRTPEEAGW